MEPAQPPTPMMDVVPRRTPVHTSVGPPEPVAVKPAPPIEDTDPPEDKTSLPAKTHKDQPKNKAKQPTAKKPNNGVGMAISATVIIVLSLATLATYAFLKTQK